ncbi:MAG: MarR family transcriptional regulator [Candidatus Falkowbacteria bacterium]|nr:MarR family transcriptional regulator [Candidatus Falkowbacteria bacterium]
MEKNNLNYDTDRNREQLLQQLMAKSGQTMKSVHAFNDFPFGSFKLSRPQVMILFFIAPKKAGATVKDLAGFMRVTSGAVTQFVDVLVEKKLVSREAANRDRRVIIIKLTDFAKKEFNHFKKEYFKNISDAFTNLSTAEIGQFIKLVAKIKTPNKAK